MWSLGVLLYALVTQRLPFYAPSDTPPADEAYEVALRVISGRYEMPSTLSPALQNLITLCLQPNAQNRIVVDQVMQHPWMRGELDMPDELQSSPELGPIISSSMLYTSSSGPSSRSSSGDKSRGRSNFEEDPLAIARSLDSCPQPDVCSGH
jgi:serine/threonine protein kinase